ncbi:hypothetical protein KY358_02420 [Candidatus Woesearchaeota archaeon]|nr:hypothetical protein [Candidatus Woesearchaeota archaeon]
MRARQKKEAELRARYFMLFTIAKIIAEITIIIGFFIFVYFVARRFM